MFRSAKEKEELLIIKTNVSSRAATRARVETYPKSSLFTIVDADSCGLSPRQTAYIFNDTCLPQLYTGTVQVALKLTVWGNSANLLHYYNHNCTGTPSNNNTYTVGTCKDGIIVNSLTPTGSGSIAIAFAGWVAAIPILAAATA